VQAAAQEALSVAECDQALRRLRIRLHAKGLAEYERALVREDIDEWLDRRLMCEALEKE
jgi:hypothetical protein